MANNLPLNTSYGGDNDQLKSLMGAISGAKNYYSKPLSYPSKRVPSITVDPEAGLGKANIPLQPALPQRDTPVPSDYSGFLPTGKSAGYVGDEPRWYTPSDEAVIRKSPEQIDFSKKDEFGNVLGETLPSGQYGYDPLQPGKLIRSERSPSKDLRKKVIGGLAGVFEVDHIDPLWAGGADLLSNEMVLSKEDHDKKTKIQAVPLTLYSNNIINLNQAKLLNSTWQKRDASIIPSLAEDGRLPTVEEAKQIWERWKEEDKKPPKGFAGHSFMDTVWSTLDAIPETLSKGTFLPVDISGSTETTSKAEEIAKGFSTGLGVVFPYKPHEEATPSEQTAGYVANVIGSIVSMAGVYSLISRGLAGAAKLAPVQKLVKATRLYDAGKVSKKAAEAGKIAKDAGILAKTDALIAKKFPGVSSILTGASKASAKGISAAGKEMAKAELASPTGVLGRMMLAGGIYGKVTNPYQQWYEEIGEKTLTEEVAKFVLDSLEVGALGTAPRGLVGGLYNAGAAFTLSTMRNMGQDPGGALIDAATMSVFHALGSKKVEEIASKIKLPTIKLPVLGRLSYKIEPTETRREIQNAREQIAKANKMFRGELTNTSHSLLSKVSKKVPKSAKSEIELDNLMKKKWSVEEIDDIAKDINNAYLKEIGKGTTPNYQKALDNMNARYEALGVLSLNGHQDTPFFKAIQDELFASKYKASMEEIKRGAFQMSKYGDKVPTPVVKSVESILKKNVKVQPRDRKNEFNTVSDLITKNKSKKGNTYQEGFTASAGYIDKNQADKFEEAIKDGRVIGQGIDKKDVPVFAVNLTDELGGTPMRVIEAERQAQVAAGVKGARTEPYTKEVVGLFGAVKGPDGKAEILNLGYVATDYRLNNKDAGFNLNLKKNPRLNEYALNQKILADAMDSKGLKVLQMWAEPQYGGPLTTKSGHKHLKLKLTEQNWKNSEVFNQANKMDDFQETIQEAAAEILSKKKAATTGAVAGTTGATPKTTAVAKTPQARTTVTATKPGDVKATQVEPYDEWASLAEATGSKKPVAQTKQSTGTKGQEAVKETQVSKQVPLTTEKIKPKQTETVTKPIVKTPITKTAKKAPIKEEIAALTTEAKFDPKTSMVTKDLTPTPPPKIEYKPLEEIMSKGRVAYSNSAKNVIVVPQKITSKQLVDYISGGVPSATSAQKKKVWSLLTPEQRKRIEGMSDFKAREFLINHERSHILKGDVKSYPRDKKGGLDLMNKKALEIEKRAIEDALTAVVPTAAEKTEASKIRGLEYRKKAFKEKDAPVREALAKAEDKMETLTADFREDPNKRYNKLLSIAKSNEPSRVKFDSRKEYTEGLESYRNETAKMAERISGYTNPKSSFFGERVVEGSEKIERIKALKPVEQALDKTMREMDDAVLNLKPKSTVEKNIQLLESIGNKNAPQKKDFATPREYQEAMKVYTDQVKADAASLARYGIRDTSKTLYNPEIAEMDSMVKKMSESLHKKYGYELNDQGFIKLNDNGSPVLSKNSPFSKTPEAIPSTVLKDIEFIKQESTRNIRNIKTQWVDNSLKSSDPYEAAGALAFDKVLREKFGDKWFKNYRLNMEVSQTNPKSWMNEVTKSLNPQGYEIEQPLEYIEALRSGDIKKMKKAKLKIEDRRIKEDLKNIEAMGSIKPTAEGAKSDILGPGLGDLKDADITRITGADAREGMVEITNKLDQFNLPLLVRASGQVPTIKDAALSGANRALSLAAKIMGNKVYFDKNGKSVLDKIVNEVVPTVEKSKIFQKYKNLVNFDEVKSLISAAKKIPEAKKHAEALADAVNSKESLVLIKKYTDKLKEIIGPVKKEASRKSVESLLPKDLAKNVKESVAKRQPGQSFIIPL